MYAFLVFLNRDLAERRKHAPAKRPVAAVLDDGPPGLRILSFYANAGEVVNGEHAVVCYGVRDAVRVRLDPPVEELKPAWNRCFSVYPRKATTYTLTAADAAGRETSARFTINVVPPPPRILFVWLTSDDIKIGEPVTVCYGVRNAVAVWLEPLKTRLRLSEKSCQRSFPVRTMKYELVAQGATGALDREPFTIKVRPR
ncbi:MAG TPA: hypothetical protein DEH78_11145 [Solibacterales bacterium]|nr:hypothetical protein [Bryobacterales bacterium]